jgi:fission process protein 1
MYIVIESTMGMATTNEEPTADESEQSPPPHNIFRDSALRYAGYANEIGESFRYQIPRLVGPTYMIAGAYVVADAVSTGHETWQNSTNKQGTNDSNSNNDNNTVWHDTIYATADTLLWQTLASVVVPGATINLVVKASRAAVHRSPLLLPVMVAKWLPTVVGIGSIPLIVQPIDHTIDYMLDNSTRHWWNGYLSSKQ